MQLSKLSFRSRSPQSIYKTTAGFSPMSMLSMCADSGITHSGGQQHSLTRQPRFHKIVLFYSSDRGKKKKSLSITAPSPSFPQQVSIFYSSVLHIVFLSPQCDCLSCHQLGRGWEFPLLNKCPSWFSFYKKART